jgi:DNA-binding response OmpR family regulator
VVCIDNDASILDGMEMVLTGWGCRVLKAPDLATAMTSIEQTGFTPRALLVDYHLDDGDGIEAIAALRKRFGDGLTAILITADRSPDVRDAARRHGVVLLHKPAKPAALRALITQVRIKRAVAAE